MTKIRRLTAYTVLCMICMMFVFSIAAPWNISAESDKSITLGCKKDDVVLEGMRWKIYRVGERADNEFVLTGDFANYSVDLIDMSVQNISDAAQTLESYAIADKIDALAYGVTGENGLITFSGLDSGLYMAVGYPVEIYPYYYEPTPLLVEVDESSDEFIFNAFPKIAKVTLGENATRYTVKKIWIDHNDAFEVRPTYVTVDLFKNEELFDTVILNESTNWQYSWVSLEPHFDWRVVEREVPVDYEVKIEYNETQYLIRNRHKTILDWDDDDRVTTTTTTSIITTVVTGDDDERTTTTTVTTHTETEDTKLPPTTTAPPVSTEKLPQTGQLWWPVIPLGLGGVLMVFGGIMMKPKKDEE